jgi:hypothetical protein
MCEGTGKRDTAPTPETDAHIQHAIKNRLNVATEAAWIARKHERERNDARLSLKHAMESEIARLRADNERFRELLTEAQPQCDQRFSDSLYYRIKAALAAVRSPEDAYHAAMEARFLAEQEAEEKAALAAVRDGKEEAK